MFKKTPISKAAVFVVSGSLLAASAAAQVQTAERIEITGSSIKRIASEGALPVQVISAEQITRSGATSVADIIQKLPAMQGFQVADIAVGSNSGGIATASIHDIGASYTLVLLNGRRIAPTGSGSTINLNAIPMSAIERIEVLTDGASALYGSDAIAGVVNFVLKRNAKGGQVTLRADKPQKSGGESAFASITYGLGDLDTSGFSLVATYRRDQEEAIKATDRDFAKTAYLPFEYEGRKYIYDRTSTSAVPANATVTFKKLTGESTTLPAYGFNPYQKQNGSCAPQNVYSLSNAVSDSSVTEYCAFDFVSTLETYPENTRDSIYLSGQVKLADKWTLSSDVAFSRLDLTARIAPNPVPVPVTVGSTLYNTYVLPYLSANQVARVDQVTANYRASDFGTRDSQTITDSKHAVLAVEGDIGGWSVGGGVTWSQNAIDEKYVGGYFKTAEFSTLRTSGTINPFIEAGGQSAAAQAAIANSIFNGTIRTASTTLSGADVRVSGDLFKLPAGMLSLGVGADFRKYTYEQTASDAAKKGDIYNYAAVPDYDMTRDNSGLFAEVVVPVIKNLEFTGALRYDRVSAIDSKGIKIGSEASDSTYKLSARYQVAPSLLLRGSFGTGFKAPSMLDIAQPLVSNGVTAASYNCPAVLAAEDGAACKPGRAQYSQMSNGNDKLKSETSEQYTLGFRFEPTSAFGFGADYWVVEISDAVNAVTANQAFADATKYRHLFMKYRTPAETQDYWAYINASTNIGKAINKGIDWDIISRFNTEIGRMTAGLAGTYLIQSSYTRPGTSNDFTDSMSRYGENAAVSFRHIMRGTLTLDNGPWSNSLTVKYRSGYKDINATVRDMATNANVRLSMYVPAYTTFDWQGQYAFSKAMELRVGVRNFTNEKPPLTLRDSSGHQVGYDPRYADVLGRTFYAQGGYKF